MGGLSRVNGQFNKPSASFGRDITILKNQHKSNSNIQNLQDQLNTHKIEVAYYECLKINDNIMEINGDDTPIYDCSIYLQ